MKEVRYVKGKDGWKRIVRIIDDAPEEYKSNYYYRNKQQAVKSETEIKIEQPRSRGEKEGKDRPNRWILCLIWIAAACFIALIFTCCFITCVNQDLQASYFVNTIVKFVICTIFKAIMWIYNIFCEICCVVFDKICNLGVF